MCKPTELPKVQPIYFLRHVPTDQTGHLIKGPYIPTGKPITIMIMTSQGKKYFAPVHEFESISNPVTEDQRYIHQLTRQMKCFPPHFTHVRPKPTQTDRSNPITPHPNRIQHIHTTPPTQHLCPFTILLNAHAIPPSISNKYLGKLS